MRSRNAYFCSSPLALTEHLWVGWASWRWSSPKTALTQTGEPPLYSTPLRHGIMIGDVNNTDYLFICRMYINQWWEGGVSLTPSTRSMQKCGDALHDNCLVPNISIRIDNTQLLFLLQQQWNERQSLSHLICPLPGHSGILFWFDVIFFFFFFSIHQCAQCIWMLSSDLKTSDQWTCVMCPSRCRITCKLYSEDRFEELL